MEAIFRSDPCKEVRKAQMGEKKELTFKAMAAESSPHLVLVQPSEFSLTEVRGPDIYVSASSASARDCL